MVKFLNSVSYPIPRSGPENQNNLQHIMKSVEENKAKLTGRIWGLCALS
jgi:hypothetical protein